jgi:hypothetical protein
VRGPPPSFSLSSLYAVFVVRRRAPHKSVCKINKIALGRSLAQTQAAYRTTQRLTYGQTHLNRPIGVASSCTCVAYAPLLCACCCCSGLGTAGFQERSGLERIAPTQRVTHGHKHAELH